MQAAGINDNTWSSEEDNVTISPPYPDTTTETTAKIYDSIINMDPVIGDQLITMKDTDKLINIDTHTNLDILEPQNPEP